LINKIVNETTTNKGTLFQQKRDLHQLVSVMESRNRLTIAQKQGLFLIISDLDEKEKLKKHSYVLK
jgi:hypothetical protein